MADTDAPKPDFRNGLPFSDLPDRTPVAGRVEDDDVVVVRHGAELFAVGAYCTHYHGPLADGLIVGETVRCPWHHACFSLRTGEALRAPALDPIPCWRVERVGDTVFVREKLARTRKARVQRLSRRPIVIVGGGAAGLAAADMLRREGYDGPVTMISADDSPPTDRPNLSKDYLAGTAQEDWIPLRSAGVLRRAAHRSACSARAWRRWTWLSRRVHLENGKTHGFDALLIATGAEPVRLDDSRRDRRAGALSAHVRGQQGNRRQPGVRDASRGRGRELHRSRGRRVAARARDRSARRRARPRSRSSG